MNPEPGANGTEDTDDKNEMNTWTVRTVMSGVTGWLLHGAVRPGGRVGAGILMSEAKLAF